MRIQLGLGALFLFLTIGCSTTTSRAPAQAAEHVHVPGEDLPTIEEHHGVGSEEFNGFEANPSRHSFILVDKKGHFAYHISSFQSVHQHQFIIKGEISKIPGIDIAKNAANGFFSVTSSKEQPFQLKELFDLKTRTKFKAVLYDGFIIGEPRKILTQSAEYSLKKIVYNTPMVAYYPKNELSTQIIFGTYGKPTKNFFMAHMIRGATNFEQILAVESEKEITVADGTLIGLNHPDADPLSPEDTYEGTIEGLSENVKFKVKRQIFFDKKESLKKPL